MTVNKIRVEKQIGRHTLSFETGQLAKQAAGCVLVQYGETVVLVAAASSDPRPGLDFFPLTCDYRERFAAAGKFPGGFLKREGRPTTKETLSSRLMDRPIRPLVAPGLQGRSSGASVRGRQRHAKRRRRVGNERCRRRAAHQQFALPGSDRLGACRQSRWRIGCLPDARRVGGKRTGHDCQRFARPSRHDRRLCR